MSTIEGKGLGPNWGHLHGVKAVRGEKLSWCGGGIGSRVWGDMVGRHVWVGKEQNSGGVFRKQ